MDNALSDFLTRLVNNRVEAAKGLDITDQTVGDFYRFLDETGVEHCNFGAFEVDGSNPDFTEFSGTRLNPNFVEEYGNELSQDDHVLRMAELLTPQKPVATFGVGLQFLDQIEAFHAPARQVQEECSRNGIVDGISFIGDTSIVSSKGTGRFFGFVFAGEDGTAKRVNEKFDQIQVASFALLDQIMPGIEARLDGFTAPLSGREREVLAAVAMGNQRKQIAFDLNIGLPTVDMHIGSVKRKLAATTLAEAVAKGYRYGIL